MAKAILEESLDPAYNHSYDEENTPQRDLTDFVVRRGGELVSICTLDDKSRSIPMTAEGTVFAPGDKGGKPVKVRLGELVEWCIEYSLTPVLWVRSKHAWYRFRKPAKEYGRAHELARRRFELCSRIFILVTMTVLDSSQTSYEGYVGLLSAPWNGMKGYTEKEILSEGSFILDQMKDLKDPRLWRNPFLNELRKKCHRTGESGSVSGGEGSDASRKGSKTDALWEPKYVLDDEGNRRLLKKVEKIISSISKHKNAWPFLQPVDPIRDGCADYFGIIRTPMDLGTIKKNLSRSEYQTASDVAKDVRLVWSNCRAYNSRKHAFSLYADTLERKFESQLRNAEEAEYAAMKKRQSNPPAKRRRLDSPDVDGSVRSYSSSKNGMKGKKGTATKLPPLHPSSGMLSRRGSDLSSLLPPLLPSHGSQGGTDANDSAKTGLGRVCANSDHCKKAAREGSKYCSDECGMAVARKRMRELTMAGVDVKEFLKIRTNKTLVLARMGH